MDYKEKIKNLPNSAGVYIMKDKDGNILYVGKAGNLKKRVSSYFRPHGGGFSERIGSMASKIEDIAYIPVSTEAEALIYENSLIKRLEPKYNVALKDDKSYPLLKLTLNEKFPRLFITRRKVNDGSAYYGPYTNVKLLREALIILRQLFPLRSCSKMLKGVCLNYHIKQCVAPCADKIDEANYGEIVSELKLFLEGRREDLLRLLSERMALASRREDFEEASRIKKRIEALSAVRENTVHYGPANEAEELKNILGMKEPLETIEAFDVSNIMGKEAVGSLVCFYKGRPRKSEYRKFRIKRATGIDDYAMMREIVKRRYARLLEEGKGLPDLVLIDGGKAHMSAALEELTGLGLSNIPVIGIAKQFEHIYAKDIREPIVLPKESKALHLLERIRDEAHRFAISYHKNLRSRNIKYSELEEIEGIGGKRKKALLNHFGNIDKIRNARLENLMKVEGMNEKSAKNIIKYFKG